ncbi:hypothetical protein [Salinisphaera orenii]|uniref:hypothetical protein n=1 Tax=Salinisphaera orenii TaxID=856731 RepID=UPI0011CE8D94|nr:hypothetical protein [Salinisphaera halophila]
METPTLKIEIACWHDRERPATGRRLLVGEPEAAGLNRAGYDARMAALAPAPSIWADDAEPNILMRRYELQLDRMPASVFGALTGLAQEPGLVLLVERAWIGNVLARYLRDWAARTPRMERRMNRAWQQSRHAAQVVFDAIDPSPDSAPPTRGDGDQGS